MNIGDIIFEQGEYKIVLYKNSFGHAVFNGESVNGKVYHFKLVKNDVDFKFYGYAVKYPSVSTDFEKMKTDVINAFKQFIL